MGRLRCSVLAALVILAAPAAAAAKPDPASPDYDEQRAASKRADETPSPRLIVVPQASFSFAFRSLFASEVGVSAAYRLPTGTDVGVHFAHTLGGPADGPSGCTELGVCTDGWWRAGALVEHHYSPKGWLDPWVGLQLDVMHVDRTRIPQIPDPHTGIAFVPMIGLDLVAAWSHALVGFGVFIAFPCSYMDNAGGCGASVGLRAPVGFL